jgi:aspartate racemase
MAEMTIGILGGMGPEATADCFVKIITNTPARTDQDHLRVVIDSNPKVPDRTAAILGRGESPLPLLVAGAEALERAGADFLIIPCVSAHFFLEDLRRRARLPILSIFDAVAETIERLRPEVKKVGLLGTTGTVEGGLLQRRLEESDIETVVPGCEVQAKIMAAIYDIKETRPARSRAEIQADLVAVAESLIAHGARGIVAACTEIPLALIQEDLAVPYFDSLLLLARAAIRRAGREPIPRP